MSPFEQYQEEVEALVRGLMADFAYYDYYGVFPQDDPLLEERCPWLAETIRTTNRFRP